MTSTETPVNDLGSGADGRLAAGLDIGIFCAGTAILAAVAYSAGNAQPPLSFTNYGFSEINTLQYCIPAFSGVLIATALIIPFLPGLLPRAVGGSGTGCWGSRPWPSSRILPSETRSSRSRKWSSP